MGIISIFLTALFFVQPLLPGSMPAGVAIPQDTLKLLNYQRAQAFYRQAIDLVAEDNLAGAVKPLEDALRVLPEHAEASLQMGICYYGLGQYEPALASIEKAQANYDKWKQLRFEVNSNSVEAAKKEAEDLKVELGELEAVRYQLQGCSRQPVEQRILFITGRLTELSRVNMEPQEDIRIPASLHFHRGNCLLMLERYDEAYEAYRTAVETDPDFGPAYNNLAALYYMAGEDADAWLCLQVAKEKGVQVEPQFEKNLIARMTKQQ